MPLTIRACKPDECAQVLELWKSAEAIPRPTDTLPELQRIVREHPDTLLVGEEAGRLVGTVIAGWDGWRGSLYRLAVVPEQRQAGVGRLLVSEAERVLRDRGCPRVTALVHLELADAGPFWTNVGYHHDVEVGRFVRNLD